MRSTAGQPKMTPSPMVPTPPMLPPGNMGLPWLGETLAFAKNGFQFIDDRVAKHGPVLKTRLLGRDTIVVSGADACRYFADPEYCLRGRPLPNIRTLFGGPSLPMLDGKTHLDRKRIVLEGFTPTALASYLPVMQQFIENSLGQWAGQHDLGWLELLKKLAMEVIFANVTGVGPGSQLDRMRADYRVLQEAFGALPIRLPFTRFGRAIRARDRILEFYGQVIAEHRKSPAGDALSRILAGRGTSGEAITDEEAKLELHHIIVAGFIIFAEFADSIIHLTRSPDVKQRLADEVKRLSPRGQLTLEKLDSMLYLTQVVMEVKRLCHILPVIFGAVRKPFELNGFQVPAGWMLLWGLRSTHLDPAIYRDPLKFDPDRFSAERAEHKRHEHAFVPHGPGPTHGHKCPGTDYATYFMKVFLVLLLRQYRWELPAQNLEYSFAITPPEPRDGLRAKFWKE